MGKVTYKIRVRAVNASGVSEWATISYNHATGVTTTVSAPTTSGIPGIEDVPPAAKTEERPKVGSIPKDVSGRYLVHDDGDFDEPDVPEINFLKQSGTRVVWSTEDGSESLAGTYTPSTGRLFFKDTENNGEGDFLCVYKADGIHCSGPWWLISPSGKRSNLGNMRFEPRPASSSGSKQGSSQSAGQSKGSSAAPSGKGQAVGGTTASDKYPAQLSGNFTITASQGGKSFSHGLTLKQEGAKLQLIGGTGAKDTLTGTYDPKTGKFSASHSDGRGMTQTVEGVCTMQAGAIQCEAKMIGVQDGKVVVNVPARLTQGAAASGTAGGATAKSGSAKTASGLADISGRYRMTGTTYGQTMTEYYRATQKGNKVVMRSEKHPDLSPYEGTYANGVLSGDFIVTDVGGVRADGSIRLEFSEKNGTLVCKGKSRVTSSVMEPFETALTCERVGD